jgi:transposase
VLGYGDEVWFSRLAQPHLSAWTADARRPLRLVERATDRSHPEHRGDPDPFALACYGLWRADTAAMWLRFAEGRPLSAMSIDFLDWVTRKLAQEGKGALLLVWDNATWHKSKAVRAWIKEHNRAAKQVGGVRVLVSYLPSKSPWLNRIEPKWVHGKRAIVEPDRKLSQDELKERLCEHFRCPLLGHLAIPLQETITQQAA